MLKELFSKVPWKKIGKTLGAIIGTALILYMAFSIIYLMYVFASAAYYGVSVTVMFAVSNHTIMNHGLIAMIVYSVSSGITTATSAIKDLRKTIKKQWGKGE